MLLDSPDLVRGTLAVLSRLINDRRRQQFRRVELADGESFEPRFLPAREALQLRSPHVPELDIDPVRATLAEEDDRHRSSLVTWRRKDKT
jgi:hypothetical protein